MHVFNVFCFPFPWLLAKNGFDCELKPGVWGSQEGSNEMNEPSWSPAGPCPFDAQCSGMLRLTRLQGMGDSLSCQSFIWEGIICFIFLAGASCHRLIWVDLIPRRICHGAHNSQVADGVRTDRWGKDWALIGPGGCTVACSLTRLEDGNQHRVTVPQVGGRAWLVYHSSEEEKGLGYI